MRSTTAVLWLMICLVFLPIAAAHGWARLHEGGSQEQVAATR